VQSLILTARPERNTKLVSVYLSFIIALGSVVFLWSLLNWHSQDQLRFASFMVAGAIASGLKVRLPGVTGTASVSVLVIVVAIADLSLPEAVMISALAVLVQCTWHAQVKPRPIQIAFSACALVVSVCASALVYDIIRHHTFEVVSVEAIAFVYFATNSFLVAVILSLTDGKPLLTIWNGNRWALAYYCIGASFAWLIGTFPPAIQWQLPIICLPMVYLVYRSNRTYLSQMERKIREEGLLRSQEELEQRVQTRTSELAEANRALEFEIDARKRTEVDLRSAKEAAEGASRAKSEFLANMSHEIRTPMNGIIGMTELALGTDLSGEQRQYLKTVMLSASAMMAVINDILDFAKIEAKKLRLDHAAFNIAECVGEAAKTLAVEAHQKGLELACGLSSNVPEVADGDRHRLRQVLLNLLGNAIKFTEKGEVVVRVEAEKRTDQNVLLHFQVKDTGIGIPKDKLGMIFEAFSQADGSWTRKYGGTGLGLTISSRLVNLMGGRMWVESEFGRGSTFHFTAQFGAQEQTEPAPIPDSDLRGLRILVIDDNATNREILAGMLAECGLEVTLAASGEEALAIVDSRRDYFSLVLVDQQMPGMDGFTFVERLRASPGRCDVTVMMLTPGRTSDAARCEQTAVTASLFKPVVRSELLNTILTALGFRSAEEVVIEPRTAEGSNEKGNPLRILIAEDIAENQAVLIGLLKSRGYVAETVSNGREVLAALEAQTFDLVLMDIQMPQLDGIEATAAIRAKEKASGAHLPIIAVTAYAMAEDRVRCLEAGMDAYVSKPILAHELFDAVERFTPAGKQRDQPSASQPAKPIETREHAGPDNVEQTRQISNLAQSLTMLGPIEIAIAAGDLKSIRTHATAMKGSITSLIAKRAFEEASVLANTTQEEDLDRAAAACQGLHDALLSLTR
jgi:signal transduction histidine kinase/DNA-binding response OmpR family regulator